MTSREIKTTALVGRILEEEVVLTLADLCRASRLPAERVIEMADEGVVEPIGRNPASWSFRGTNLRRIRRAERLRHDLGVNTAGVALVLELLEELDRLRSRLERLEP